MDLIGSWRARKVKLRTLSSGRMETLRMLPLAQAEIAGKAPSFLERLFAGKLQGDRKAIIGDELVRLALLGGFPEAISRDSRKSEKIVARLLEQGAEPRQLFGSAQGAKP